MQIVKQRPWKINLTAKSKTFHFKFKARITKPTCKFLKFSLFLKLHKSLFDNTAESRISILKNSKTSLKSKFLKFFHKFKALSGKKRAITAQKTLVLQNPDSKFLSNPFTRFIVEGPISIESLLVLTIALLSKFIYENDKNGIKLHGISILSFMALFFKKYVIIKLRNLVVYLTIALVFLAIIFPFDKYIYQGSRDYYVYKILCKAWNYVASSGSLYVFFQVIFSRFCTYVGGNRRRNS